MSVYLAVHLPLVEMSVVTNMYILSKVSIQWRRFSDSRLVQIIHLLSLLYLERHQCDAVVNYGELLLAARVGALLIIIFFKSSFLTLKVY